MRGRLLIISFGVSFVKNCNGKLEQLIFVLSYRCVYLSVLKAYNLTKSAL